MATRKDQKSKSGRQSKQRRSQPSDEWAFPSEQQRLPSHNPGVQQVAMGTRAEVAAWLQTVPRNTQVILINFSDEASYRTYGPIFWHVAQDLPEIIARVRRRKFEQLVDALTEFRLESREPHLRRIRQPE